MGLDGETDSRAKVEHANEWMNQEVAEQVKSPPLDQVADALQFTAEMAWLRDPSFYEASSLLGRVYYKLHGDTSFRSHIYSLDLEMLPGANDPLVRQELILNAEAAANASFLEFLKLNISAKEVYELRVVDNARVRAKVIGERWESEIEKWLNRQREVRTPTLESSNLSYCAVVTGVAQKFVTKKRYSEFEGEGKGGGYGVNVDGRLFLSSQQFDLDIAYGLSLQDLLPHIVGAEPRAATGATEINLQVTEAEPTGQQIVADPLRRSESSASGELVDATVEFKKAAWDQDDILAPPAR